VYDISLNSRPVWEFVTELCGSGSYEKAVPREVLIGSPDEKLAFVNGITLDGYVSSQSLVVYGGMSETLVRLNHTTNPGSCDQANRTGHCLLVRLDGSVVNVAGITPRFADVVAAGNFTGDRGFAVATGTLDPAVRLQVALAADPLPATATATRVENVTALEGTDGTPTADPVTTEPGGSPTATPADGSPGGAESPPSDTPVTTGGGTPGFTPVALLLAVLALAALAAQTDRS